MAAFQGEVETITARASADLSAKQFYAGVYSQSSGQRVVNVAGAGTANCIIFNAPTSGNLADIVIDGTAKAKLGNTVTTGQFLKSDSSGKLIPVAANNDKYIAIALKDGVANDIIPVQVEPGFYGA